MAEPTGYGIGPFPGTPRQQTGLRRELRALTKVVDRGEPFQLTTGILTEVRPFRHVRPARCRTPSRIPKTEVMPAAKS